MHPHGRQFIHRVALVAAVCLVLIGTASSSLAEGKIIKDVDNACLPKDSSGKTLEVTPFTKALYSSSIKGGLLGGVTDACIQCGACQLCDFLNIANQLARMIFGIFGAVALAMFIYGGVQFIVSSGNSDLVGKAKSTLVNAVIGIFFIAFAWQIVHVVLIVLGTPEEQGKPGAQLIFGKPWDNPCGQKTTAAVAPEQNQADTPAP